MTYFGLCPCCRRWSFGLNKRRMSTLYCDEESNWMESCEYCFEQMEDYWRERWADYYADCL